MATETEVKVPEIIFKDDALSPIWEKVKREERIRQSPGTHHGTKTIGIADPHIGGHLADTTSTSTNNR